jgi:stage II sporulation protein D
MRVVAARSKITRISALGLLAGCVLIGGCLAPKPPKGSDEPGGPFFSEEPEITVYFHASGETKSMLLEEYLAGVVAGEMDPQWPAEALRAQAILARTFTMERMLFMGGVPQRGTDASTDVREFQAYDAGRINDAVRQAVQKTRGQVVVHEGQLIKAWFFADAGGITAASALEGLAYDKAPSPYVHSVKDPGFDITSEENKSWRTSFALGEIREKIRSITGRDPGTITTARIAERGPSGRATKLQFNSVVVGGPALRLAMGGKALRSLMITDISVSDGRAVITGKGYGHGVGMSQWGARALAEQGKTAGEIIQYFFKDVEILRRY